MLLVGKSGRASATGSCSETDYLHELERINNETRGFVPIDAAQERRPPVANHLATDSSSHISMATDSGVVSMVQRQGTATTASTATPSNIVPAKHASTKADVFASGEFY